MKKKYPSRSLEKLLDAPREHVWQLLNELSAQDLPRNLPSTDPAHDPTIVETLLSFEPPWRRAYSLSGPATNLSLCHAAYFLRDQGPQCQLSWGVVVNPQPSTQGLEFLECTVAATAAFINHIANHLAANHIAAQATATPNLAGAPNAK